MSDMVPVDEVAEHDGLPVVWNSQKQQQPFTTHSSSSGQDGLTREQQQQQQSQSQLQEAAATLKAQSWRRILLLVIAIVIHNFPEGMAVGVGFGALNDLQPVSGDAAAALSPEEELSRQSAYAARFSEAVTLAFGIGLQNFPEGLAVSLPLLRVGFSRSTAFMYGQLSGMVEPLGGLLGAALVGLMQPILPYALAFAAGAMIFVVVEVRMAHMRRTRGEVFVQRRGSADGTSSQAALLLPTHALLPCSLLACVCVLWCFFVLQDLIPETRSPGGFPQLASAFVMVGFCTMMSMDVFFG
jgi:zinc transporter ZupT